jgi:hypothetical protein
MNSSPLDTTTKNCFHSFFLALLPALSQYCLCWSMPSFAHGAPRRASSSSSISSRVERDVCESTDATSSSCSLITVWDRLDAKPSEAANAVAVCHRQRGPNRTGPPAQVTAHLVYGRGVTRCGAEPSVRSSKRPVVRVIEQPLDPRILPRLSALTRSDGLRIVLFRLRSSELLDSIDCLLTAELIGRRIRSDRTAAKMSCRQLPSRVVCLTLSAFSASSSHDLV